MLGFNPGIQRHKALAHDMHAESIALQQRFAPQPELRSSWQQFVIAGLIFLSVIAGLGPAIQSQELLLCFLIFFSFLELEHRKNRTGIALIDVFRIRIGAVTKAYQPHTPVRALRG